jgi:hypothetical protein
MMNSPNVKLHLIELAYGDRPWEVTNPSLYPDDIQVRTNTELFHKENAMNLAVRHFPQGWKYGAIIDADLMFTRHDWALETIHQLQHYDFVQMFSTYSHLSGKTLGTGHQAIWSAPGFAFNYVKRGYRIPTGWGNGFTSPVTHPDGYEYSLKAAKKNAPESPGAPGGAWAFTSSAFNTVGGMLDKCILGSGDHFMAFGLVGDEGKIDKEIGGYTQSYRNYIRAWQLRALQLRRKIGYVDCHVIHHFHGPMRNRAYGTRDKILVDNKYNPNTDVYYDWQGVLQLTPDKPVLRDAIRQYFLDRSEDEPQPRS